MSKCSGEHQHSWGKEGHAHGHGTMWYEGDPNKLHHHHDIICLQAKDAEIASLRAEIGNSEAVRLGMEKKIADLKDGLTAAHMDGFASGKAEATEMLRKRDGQLEELRAEVKAYREVEDSLQKEIKRLDAEVERLNHAIAHMRWALEDSGIDSSAVEQGECLYKKSLERTCDCEFNEGGNLVDECDYHAALRAKLEQAERELAAERKKVEKVRELNNYARFAHKGFHKDYDAFTKKIEEIVK